MTTQTKDPPKVKEQDSADDDSNVQLEIVGKVASNAPNTSRETYSFTIDTVDDEATITDVMLGMMQAVGPQTRLDPTTIKEVTFRFK